MSKAFLTGTVSVLMVGAVPFTAYSQDHCFGDFCKKSQVVVTRCIGQVKFGECLGCIDRNNDSTCDRNQETTQTNESVSKASDRATTQNGSARNARPTPKPKAKPDPKSSGASLKPTPTATPTAVATPTPAPVATPITTPSPVSTPFDDSSPRGNIAGGLAGGLLGSLVGGLRGGGGGAGLGGGGGLFGGGGSGGGCGSGGCSAGGCGSGGCSAGGNSCGVSGAGNGSSCPVVGQGFFGSEAQGTQQDIQQRIAEDPNQSSTQTDDRAQPPQTDVVPVSPDGNIYPTNPEQLRAALSEGDGKKLVVSSGRCRHCPRNLANINQQGYEAVVVNADTFPDGLRGVQSQLPTNYSVRSYPTTFDINSGGRLSNPRAGVHAIAPNRR